MAKVKPYRYLFKCGHYVESKNKNTVCTKCGCKEIQFMIHSNTDHLDGRHAICGNRSVRSRWDLPGFIYRPNEETDLFLFGNKQEINNNGTVYSVKKYLDEIRKDKQ